MNNLCMCLWLQQFEWGVEAAGLRAVRADKAENTGEWSNEAGVGRSSQETRDSWPHVATGALKHRHTYILIFVLTIITSFGLYSQSTTKSHCLGFVSIKIPKCFFAARLDYIIIYYLHFMSVFVLFFPSSAPASQIPLMPPSRSSYCWERSSSWRHTITRSVNTEGLSPTVICICVMLVAKLLFILSLSLKQLNII